MNKKTKGIIAGVAGGALLLGAGGTFALWSDSGSVQGGTIQAGTLDVSVDTAMSWYDASQDQADATGIWSDFSWDDVDFGAETTLGSGVTTEFGSLSGDVTGHSINLSSWRAVPGDFVLGESTLTATVDGDNIEAGLNVDVANGMSGDLANGLGVRTVVVEEDGAGNFQRVLDTGKLGDTVKLDLRDGTTTLRAYVVANFPSGTSNQDLINTSATLSQVDVTLKQMR